MVPVSNIMGGTITVIFKLFPTTFSNEMTLLRKQFAMVMGGIENLSWFHWGK